MAEFLESKRIRPNKPRPTQAQLTRLSNREFNALTEKYPKRQSRGREVGCLGRMPEKEYKVLHSFYINEQKILNKRG